MAQAVRTGGEPVAETVTLVARNRLPSDVVGELMDVLSGLPRIVVCDLNGMAFVSRMIDVFAPVTPYLSCWPGTLVVACVPHPDRHLALSSVAIPRRLLVHAHCPDGVEEAHRLLSPLEQVTTHLAPVPEAAGQARQFTFRTLRDWDLHSAVGPASVVVSELVTDSLVHARTVLSLSLSRCQDRLRIAVHDHGGGRPFTDTAERFDEVEGRGLVLVQTLSLSWGVFPTHSRGKTVWAVLGTG
ncbi:MAG: ATP-binding protein [Actinomycetota bacterium]|nr:ATP-binding protein [Actinomycetota bacterium]